MADSFSLLFNPNFQILVTDGTNALESITGSVTIQGQVYNFTTDANGLSQSFEIFLNNDYAVTGNIPAQDGFDEFNINETFTPPLQTLEIILTSPPPVPVLPRFRYNVLQPLRIIEEKTGDFVGYDNKLFQDIQLGTRGNIVQSRCQKRLLDKSEDITVYSDADSATLKIFNVSDDTQQGVDIPMALIAPSLWNTSFIWSTLSIPAGVYYVQIVLTNSDGDTVLRSEPLAVKATWKYHALIEYTNYSNRKDLIFRRVPNVEYYLIISANLIPIDDNGEVDLFVDDENTSTEVFDEVYDDFNFITLSPHPWYEIKTAQIAFGCDEFKINGMEAVKLDQGSREVFGAFGLMFQYQIPLRRKEFNQINYYDNAEPEPDPDQLP